MELIVQKLSKTYGGIDALSQVDLRFTPGVCGLLGPNGSGKTTLMRLLCGLITPTCGTVEYNREKITGRSEAYRDILGYMPQELGFYQDLSAEQFLMYIAAVKGIEDKAQKSKVKHYLELVGLFEDRKKKIRGFSGGMKRRLGIAQAMINSPRVLILDEPTAGLDPKERVRFRNIIAQVALNRIVIISTHIVSDIDSIADRVILLKKGRIAADGKPDKLVSSIRDCVWHLTVRQAEVGTFEKSFKIANLRSEGGLVLLRILSDVKPAPDAVPQRASLEDLYLWYFYDLIGNNGGEADE